MKRNDDVELKTVIFSSGGWKSVGASSVAVFLILMVILNAGGSSAAFESPILLALLNTIFLCAIPLVIAYFATKSHHATGVFAFLMIGCGLVFFGVSSLYAGWVMPLAGGPNPNVTVYNLGSLFAGVCQFAGAHFFLQELTGVSENKLRVKQYGILYAGIFVLVSIITILAFRGYLPVFFDPLTGPSPLRQFVLGGAICLFAVAGLMFMEIYAATKTEFAYWYGLALWLIAIGLTCVLLQRSVGSVLGWTGRVAQYLGSIYFIFAFLWGRRELSAATSSSTAKTDWVLWPYLEHRVRERTAALVRINEAMKNRIAEVKRAEEQLFIANQELLFQNEEKEKRAAELVVANKELVFQNEEKEKRAAELILANKELLFQNEEKEKRAAELVIANKELAFQNEEKEKRAAELILANKELLFQNEEKEKRAAELVLANKELAFQNEEKEKRAAELVLANKELAFQNEEKEKRAAELAIANKELLFQNEEKEKRAAELVLANQELAFQNEEKEKRAAELIIANEETVRRLQNIQALHKIDQAIAGSLDLNLTLNVVLEQVKTQLNIDAAAVLLLNPHTQILEFTSGFGFRSKAIEQSRQRLGEGLGGRAALERRTMSVTNLLENSTHFVRASLLADEGFVTYFGTPLIAKGQVNGVLEIFHRSPFSPDENWLEFFKILAGQAAIAVDSASLFTDLIHSNAELFAAYDSTIEGWSHALDLRDKETEGHTQRVTEMTMKLTHAAGMTEAELVHVRRGALLHDIGKMGVPDHILLKPEKLTDEEWVAMRKHPTFAFELLSPIAYLRPALDIPYCHHEKWDGSGYPRGLKGEQIPLAARLFAIVDVWDALLSDRPYRQGWSKEKVIEHIKSLSGTHFDPKIVELFLKFDVETKEKNNNEQ